MARSQAAEYWGGAAYYAAGSNHLIHPRYATAIRVEGTTGETVSLPKPGTVKGAERFWIFNHGPNSAEVLDSDGSAVTTVANGDSCVIFPDGDGGWVVGSTYTVEYP